MLLLPGFVHMLVGLRDCIAGLWFFFALFPTSFAFHVGLLLLLFFLFYLLLLLLLLFIIIYY